MRARLHKWLKRFARSERGTQMVEFAFALPFLLLFFAGTAELGRMFYTYTTLAKATMVGARYASTVSSVSSSTGAIKTMVVCGDPASCGGAGAPAVVTGLSTANVAVTQSTDADGVRYVTVSVSYPYHPLVFDLAGMTGDSALSLDTTLAPQTTMRYMR